mmetsp:Transcript_37555/g.42914  ORF Transcript_37555/g.42914 Transcript_37555/m.42914 type:complete len:166 (+) Transcript_37555:128-625(+)|eukprot:CAMPEP_0194140444 /NCGR_PEP_ID=MMETSP0152-20130528/9989_1 /TAXON_ID=1049557 /ORGANISM="Thalassiothrix antarctica, Strain L6-D1" /LENGTH=165 /DNA_ID=CAMNT_0038838691 /DNA_START=65 /DNA_END=562 /DNA_ORIENTATION=-
MNKIFSILLLFLSSISAFSPFNVPHKYKPSSALFTIADYKADFKVSPKTFLLDVREHNEWAEGHLKFATPAPLSQLTSGRWMDNTTGKYYPGTFPIDRYTSVAILKNVKIYIHCKMGGRAKQAGELLNQMGYQNVVVIEETFDELVAAEICEVVKGEVQSLTDMD